MTNTWFKRLEEEIQKYNLLNHPFYQKWQRGELDLEHLREYGKQYYAHVMAFPTYLSATHANCNDLKTRQILLENLMEEERGEKNHPTLWTYFLESLGLSSEEWEKAQLLPETQESVEALRNITRNGSYLEGVAALYAYESQVPEVAKTKREGLAAFYGISDEKAVSFFTVHEEADLVHREMEKEILLDHCNTKEEQEKAISAAREGAKALWHFLDGVYNAFVLN